MDLFSRPNSTRKMIPQLLWAKIKARRHFFLTTCTKEMLDVPPESSPCIARAKLHAHTLLFLTGSKVSIVGVPHQWLDNIDKPGPAKKTKSGNTATEGMEAAALPATMDGMASLARRGKPMSQQKSPRHRNKAAKAVILMDHWHLHSPVH
jgi:hypothetical protein